MHNDDHSHQHERHDPATHDWNPMYTGQASDQEPPDPLILAIVEQLTPGRSLDVGCGAGGLVAALAERGWQASGIDIASSGIAAAEKATHARGLRAEFLVADASTWRPPQRYDLITCTFALPGLPAAQHQALAMMKDALSPGGTVLIKDFDPGMKKKQPAFEAWHCASPGELNQAFAGLEIVRCEVVPTPVHDHDGSGSNAGQEWTATLLHARRPA